MKSLILTGQALREIRISQKLNVKELALKLKVTEKSYYSLERLLLLPIKYVRPILSITRMTEEQLEHWLQAVDEQKQGKLPYVTFKEWDDRPFGMRTPIVQKKVL